MKATLRPTLRVLIVDDNPEDRAVLLRYLRLDLAYAHQVEEASTGEAAIQACQESRPYDLILLDHHLPKLSGLDVLKAIKAIPGWRGAVIACTSTSLPETARNAFEAGATDFLHKEDLSASILSRTLQHALIKRRLELEVLEAADRTDRLQKMTAHLSGASSQSEVMSAITNSGAGALQALSCSVSLLLEQAPPSSTFEESGQITASIPLTAGEQVLGAMKVSFAADRFFSTQDQAFFRLVGAVCGAALERSRLYEGAETARQESRRSEDLFRESETRFRAMANAVPSSVFESHSNGFCTWMADTWSTYTGLKTAQALGWGWTDSIHPDDRARTSGLWEDAVRLELAFETRRRMRRFDGEYRWFFVRAVPQKDEGGKVIRWLGSSTDIDDAVRAENEALDRAAFEKQLIGIVSHDLKNPLSAIKLSAELLTRRGDLDERAQKAVSRVSLSADRAHRMIQDLLDFTQVRLGSGIPLRPDRSNLSAIVADVLDEVRLAFPSRQLAFTRDEWVWGLWDVGRLEQVVSNLLTNALKYSPLTSTVSIRLTQTRERALLEIHNDGAPIPEKLLGYIFEPLRRGMGGEHPTGRSVGLGLYIVKQIVTAHQGQVRVKSEEGFGTAFTVDLPRQDAATAVDSPSLGVARE